MTSIAGVLIDLDNTLVDRNAAVLAWLLERFPRETALDLANLDAHGYGDRTTFFQALAAASGGVAEQVRQDFRRGVPTHLRLMAGASELLDRIGDRLRVGIATNGSETMQRAKLAAVGLDRRVPIAVISGAIGVAKPAPGFFAAALAALGTSAAATLMIGDHPRNDIEGAHLAGLRTCWLRSPHFAAPSTADHIIDSLVEAPV